MGYLYHYTSSENIDRINKTGYIKPSTNTVSDAFAGVGVYFTDLPPSAGEDKIIMNNWGRHTSTFDDSYVEWCIRIPMNSLRGVRKHVIGKRVIYCYPGRGVLDLSAVPHAFIEVRTGRVFSQQGGDGGIGWGWIPLLGAVALGAVAVGRAVLNM